MTVRRQIVAFGGGGFLMEPNNPLIDQFVLSVARRETPRVCFLPTASGDSPVAICRFYRRFSRMKCEPADLTLTGTPELPPNAPTFASLRDFLCEQDIVYVGGGNTVTMLRTWKEHQLGRVLREAWESGTVLCGVSAGMICWFRGGLTDSYGPLAPLDENLGFIETSACPHYDSEPARKPAYRNLIASGYAPGFATEDGAALHFVDDELVEVVSSRPHAKAFWVDRQGNDSVLETELGVRYLG